MKLSNTLALTACLSIVSLGASAHQITVDGPVEASGDGYIIVGGNALKTGLGGCLQTGSLSEDNQINACEGIEDEVAEAEAAPEVVEKVAEAPAAPAAPVGKIDTRQFSEQTLFDTNSASLTSAGDAAMNAMFGALAEYKGITGISVTGHTDSRGSDEYNQALSERRAQTVADLIAARYPDARMEVQGLGESSPVASNDNAEGRQLNRRVDVEITATRMIFN